MRVPPERDPRSGRVREEWLVREIDPACSRALGLALRLKAARPGTDVTVVHLGPPNAEPWLRRALAAGCRPGGAHLGRRGRRGRAPRGKAVILAAAAQAAGFDLVLTGAAGVVDGNGQLGVLLAAHLGVPCVTQVVGIAPLEHTDSVELSRGLTGAFRETGGRCCFLVVATVCGRSCPAV